MFQSVREYAALTAAITLLAVSPAHAQDATWPREIPTDQGTLILYQPQPETFSGNVLTGRAAASYTARETADPIFGTLWFTARVDVDRDAGTTEVRNIVIDRARWPDVTEEKERGVTEYLTAKLENVVVPISFERLSESLASAEVERKSLEGLRNDPPNIVFSEDLAELLLYDGEPRTIPIPDTDLEQVANAAFAVIRDTRDGKYYLSGGKIWYSASDPLGPWDAIGEPPAEVARLVPPDTSSIPAPQPPPLIVAATEPTELVVTDGAPAWRPIGNGDLLYVENTETPIVREVETNDVYILTAGRWFRSRSLDGPWTFVPPDELPSSFRDLPPASDLGGVRVSVAGTREAEDAVLDSQVPQTAAIQRSEASLEVSYDGEPRFERIEGTSVDHAVNTGSQVLRIDGRYYACDNGVWFASDSATGPWEVADSIPADQIEEIPPSSSQYNLTHVHVYDSTPQVVYVGYTPGYMWSFPYYGVPVYGTGWYYPPYWGPRYYYPRPVTYGFHVGYNPWYGWSFGFSWSVGFMSVGIRFGGGYGGYYRPGYRPGWHGGYPPGGYRRPVVINTGDINIGNRVNVGNQVRPGTRPSPATADRPTSLYNQGANRDRLADAGTLETANRDRADRVARGPNNVLSDRDGNIYERKPDGGWNSREQGQWKPAVPEARPSQPQTRPSQPQARPSQPQARPSQPQARPSQPQARPSQPQARPSQPQARPVPSNVQRDYGARVQGAQRATPQRSGGARRR
jgi:hypothetical protein